MHHSPAPRREQQHAVEPVPRVRFEGASGELVTVAAAAALLGIPRHELAQQIERGRLTTATLVRGRQMIGRAEIDWLVS
jgi:hypothetical protein